MRRHAVLLGTALALAAGLTACGDDGVKRTDFLAKADRACDPGNASVAAIAKPTNLPDLSTAAGTLATTVDGQVAELRKLEAPKDDKVVVDGVLQTIADVAGSARVLQEAAGKTDDAATARAASDLKGKTDAGAVQAEAYGLRSCGKGLQAPAAAIFEGGRSVVKAAFVAKADALCAAANKKAAALASPNSLAGVARYMASYLPIEEKLFADIKALPVPPGDEGTLSDMFTAQDLVIAKDKELLAAAQARNEALFDRLDEQEATLITAANAKFDSYGLRNCGTLSAF